jgi:radical SAM protein with 4Fe4S-binding SPASM domain
MINVSRLYCGIENSSDDFRYRFDIGKGPIIVYNCTNKCNQNCLHCYSKTGLTDQLDTSQAKELLRQLAEIKCAVVLFSGGEPLERADLFELLDFSRESNLRAVLSTNGSLIDSKIAKKIADTGISYVGISIDGNQKTHDEFRRTKDSFTKATSAVKFCKDADVKVGLRFTITKRNFNQIRDVFPLAAQLNIQRICFYHLISAGNAARNNLKCTNGQIRQALNDICDCAQSYALKGVTEVLTVGNHADGPFILNRLKQENSPLHQKSSNLLQKFGGNKIGVKIFAIDAVGSVHPDQFWQNYSLGNITETKLEDILKDSLNIFKDKTLFAPHRCKKCKWLNLCGTNARFVFPCHSRESGNLKSGLSAEAPALHSMQCDGGLAKAEWLLEPDCYLNDEEISITGVSNAEFTRQDAKA